MRGGKALPGCAPQSSSEHSNVGINLTTKPRFLSFVAIIICLITIFDDVSEKKYISNVPLRVLSLKSLSAITFPGLRGCVSLSPAKTEQRRYSQILLFGKFGQALLQI